jgi:predicted short-subunit dehydrogenase-like oxidoreductase (DUF2520 family)
MATVSIVGAGKAGRTLGKLLRRAGYTIEFVVTAHPRSAKEAVTFIGSGRASTRLETPSDINILAVPDGEIENAARRTRFHKGQVVLHLCGNYSSEILGSARPAWIGSMHPLKSFAKPEIAAKTFAGTTCAYEGDPAAERVMKSMIQKIQGMPLKVRAGRKPLYHAAAVFAANYVLTVMDMAFELFRESGITDPGPLLKLARGTLDNIERIGTRKALTGPIQRGDRRTIDMHLAALKKHGRAFDRLYALLGLHTARIAGNRKSAAALIRGLR